MSLVKPPQCRPPRLGETTKVASISSLNNSRRRTKSQIFSRNKIKKMTDGRLPPPLDLSNKAVKPLTIPLDLPPMPTDKIPKDSQVSAFQLPDFNSSTPKLSKDDSFQNISFENLPPPPPPITNKTVTPKITQTKLPKILPPPPANISLDNLVSPRKLANLETTNTLRAHSSYEHSSNDNFIPKLAPKKKNIHISDPIGSLNVAARDVTALHKLELIKVARDSLTSEDIDKMNNLSSHGDILQYCITDSHLTNSSNHCFLPHLPEIIEASSRGMLFLNYAKQHFQIQKQKKHLQRKQVSVNSLIEFSKKLSNSLHNFESKDMQRMALEMFEKILTYMGDGKRTDNPDSIFQSFIEVLVKKPELGDEAYCQIVKQMTNNPKNDSIMKGWHLLAGTCNFVPPRNALLPYLASWIDNQKTTFVAQAWYCLQSLQKTINRKSNRRTGPSAEELLSIKNGTPMLCRLCTYGGTQKAIYVDSSTTVSQAIHTFCERIGIPHSMRNLFCIEILSNETQLEKLTRVNGYICDLITAAQNIQQSNVKLCVEQYIFTNRRGTIDDIQTTSISFHQIKREFILGNFYCGDSPAIKLASYLLQYQFGDYTEEKPFPIQEYLPPSIIANLSQEEIIKRVNTEHFGLMGVSKEKAISGFVYQCQKLEFYGSLILDVEINNIDDWSEIKEKSVKFVLNEDNVCFYSQNLVEKYTSFPLSKIMRWKPSGSTITLSIGGFTAELIIQSSKYQSIGMISRYLTGYANALLASAKYAIAQKDYHPLESSSNDDLLRFNKGEVIHIIQHDLGNGWEFGTVDGVHKGNFPLSYVLHTPYLPDPRSPKGNTTGVNTTVITESFPMHEEVLPLFVEFAKNKCRTRRLQNEYIINLKNRFTYSDQPLTHSLLIMESVDNKIALEIYNHFLKYLSSHKLRNIIDVISKIGKNSNLRNEVYCQALKHTLSNMNEETCRSAWEWLTMLTIAFNPQSEHLLEIIELYIELQGITDPDQRVVLLARHALLQISRRKQHGDRRTLPTIKEYEAIQQGSLYQMTKIKTLTNSTVSLIDACSTVTEITTKLGLESLRLPSVDYFGLYIYNEKAFNLPININTKIVDVLATHKDCQLNLDALVWNFRFTPTMDENLLTALFGLMRNRVLNGNVACSLNHVLDIAAFLMQGSNIQTVTKQNISMLLPKHVLAKHQGDSAVQKIQETYNAMQLSVMSQTEAKLAFLTNATNKMKWNWTCFPLIRAKKTSTIPKKYLAVSTNGVGLFKLEGDVYNLSKQWEFESISSVGTYTVDNQIRIIINFRNQTSKSFPLIQSVLKTFRFIYDKYQQPPQ